MTNQYVNPWTDERVELLKKRWADGHSASVIAAEFKTSRGAIIGKVDRLNLPSRHTVTFRTDENAIRRSNAPKPKAPKEQRIRIPKLKVEPIPEAPAIFTAEHFRTIGQIENEHCRWPCWEEGATADQQFYCGTPTADVADGRSWCGYHARIAYTPAQPRKSVKHWATFGKRQVAA